MKGGFEGLVAIRQGPTFIRTVGLGPPVFVLHGGPGFDHRYLLPVLQSLARRRTLIFYDQPGCGRSPAPLAGPTAEATFRHFQAVMREFGAGEPAGLFAHSWGALVAIAARAMDPALPAFAEGMLVNPTPVVRAEYEVCRQNLLLRLPPETLAEVMRLYESNSDGARIMAHVLPYYHGRAPRKPLTPFALHTDTYHAVDATLGDFDHSAGLPALRNLAVVMGERDFTSPDLVAEIIAAAASVDVLSELGHFPFFEDPEAFAPLIARAFPD